MDRASGAGRAHARHENHQGAAQGRVSAPSSIPHALAAWLPPAGMSGHVHVFEPRVGGNFRMSLQYAIRSDPPGKTSTGTDTFQGRFAELIPHEKIVWIAHSNPSDPAFAGEMTIIAHLSLTNGGHRNRNGCENIPKGIRLEDNVDGLPFVLAESRYTCRKGKY